MVIDRIIVLISELVAFIIWLYHFKKFKDLKLKLFTIFLGLLAITDLVYNILFPFNSKMASNLLQYFIIPFQFIFFYFFLLFNIEKKSKLLSVLFTIIYLTFFIVEISHLFTIPTNFDSISYGIGNLLLIVAIFIALKAILKTKSVLEYNQSTDFWIVIGLVIFYIVSFPYQNFRSLFWENQSFEDIAYFLEYLSQSLKCIMYIMFAYAVQWLPKPKIEEPIFPFD